MVKKIGYEEFRNEALQGCAVVDFSATWCGPCKMLAPVLEQVSEELEQVKFFNVDVDEAADLAAEYGISNIPAMLVLKDGIKQDILVGFKPKDVIVNEIKELL